jgi:hypothetical protein
MSIYEVKNVLHRIRVRLIPNNLLNVRGAYVAGVSNEAELSLEDVAAALKNRGGFTGNYHDMVEHVRQFLREAAYQLCDGFAVNLGWFSIRPVVGGGFETAHEVFDREKHPVSFRFRARAPLRDRARHIVIELDGPADICGCIDSFTDAASGAVNGTLTPGGLFSISGRKIKVAGNDPECGVWFVSLANPAQRHKVSSALAENVSTKLIGLVPALPAGEYAIEIKTQYTLGGKDLKKPRTVKSGFTLNAE